MRVGGIDPGVHTVWWAYFEKIDDRGFLFTKAGSFEHVSFWSTRARVQMLRLDLVAVEMPQVYAGKAKGDNNDLIDLALVAGACAAGVEDALVPTPRKWKGTMKKDAHNAKTLRALSRGEDALLQTILAGYAKGLHHNIIDAVGLAAWRCGRIR